MKPKAQPESMPKGKKRPETLEIEKMNRQMEEPMNLFIRKPIQPFNLEDENASLRAKVTQDKEESDKLKAENKKLNARLEESMNAACIQSEEMEEEIRRLTKKLDETQDLQEQLTLARQDAFEARDELNRKSYHDPTPTPVNWRKRGVDPAERLSGTDPDKWDSWLYSIEEKLDADAPLYETEKRRVAYALSQTSDILFKGMQSWVNSKKGAATLHEFLDEAKHITGVHRLKADAKRELLSITMQYSETVSQYYQRIFRLWEHAGTPADERIEKFIRTLRPLISAPLLGRRYTDIKDLLDEARNIEDMKKDIVVNFPKQEKFGTSRSNRGVRGLTGGSAGSAGSAGPAAGSTDAKGGSAGANRDRVHPNSKFGPTSTKPEGWIGTWHKPQAFPKKLTDEERIAIAREGRCWSCRGSGHRISDDCCPSKKKTYLNVAKVEEAGSGSESEAEKA